MPDTVLDVDFCRSFFPPLSNGEVYFENAGGSYAPRQVIDTLTAFMGECQCQPGWQFASSRSARARLDRAQALMAEAINADYDEIVIGPIHHAQCVRAGSRAGAPAGTGLRDRRHQPGSRGQRRRLAALGRHWRDGP